MEPPPMHRSSTGKDTSKSDSLCDRFVTGNPDLDNWIWIIDYFAKFKTELSMLHDVFEMGPKLPDDLGQHTNEMVAFRCLASLFDCSTPLQSEDVAISKVEFDLSESCEYVLQCILDEIPLSDLKPGAPGLSKWNLLPFIQSKLLCLPKCAFELMMESSYEKDTGVSRCKEIEPSGEKEDTGISSCKGIEATRIDDKETDQVAPQMAYPDRQSVGHGHGDEINRSHALFERRNEGHPNESDGYRCIRCKQRGKLLFCSSDGCIVMVHAKCLETAPTYDDAGNFYCSRCASKRVLAEYLQSKEEVAKAKKKLISFYSFMSKLNKTKTIQD